MIKGRNKHIKKWSKIERFLVPKQMGQFLGNSPTVNCKHTINVLKF